MTRPNRNAFQRTPAIIWLFMALVVVLALLIGFAIGSSRSGDSQTMAPSPSAQNSTSSPESDAEQPADNNAAAKTEDAEPGTDFSEPSDPDPFLNGPGAPIESSEDILNVHRRDAQDPFAMGALDAPVVISEFSDFECPFCAQFAVESAPKIKEKYVDTGLVRFEWNDLPINGPQSLDAARAGRAAAAQGKFYAFHEALFAESSQGQGHPGFGIEDFVRFAETAGVDDIERFRDEAEGDLYAEAVEEARSFATSVGMNATPSFIVGDQFVSGAQPFEVFDEEIQRQLAKSQGHQRQG